jgi:hypothetical protein
MPAKAPVVAIGSSSLPPVAPSSSATPMAMPAQAPVVAIGSSSLRPVAPSSPAPMSVPAQAPVVAPSNPVPVAAPSPVKSPVAGPVSGSRPFFETLIHNAQQKQSKAATSKAPTTSSVVDDNDNPCDRVLHTCTLKKDSAPGAMLHWTFFGFCFAQCQPLKIARRSVDDFGYKCGPCPSTTTKP